MILWKDSVDGPVQTYKLNTVTYGTTCAPYLATRTIQQLARDEGEHYPLAASVTIRDIYMDDILTGSSDFQEFQKLQLELISLFKKAGMSLHKWCSNTPEILNSIPKEEQSWDFHCQSSDQKTIKTLGIIWSPQFDYFSFKTVVNCRESYTKREVLSIIARLFDPLGFLGPILTKAKLILQKLWVLKLEWDEPLSNPIAKEWNDFVSTLPVIQNIHVPRLVIGKGRIIIHGFADASTAAYGAVLYAQSISEEDVSTRLLCSKSRVAPVKPITIPRLELCACVLLSQLLEKVLHSLTLPIQQIMLWTDSNIVLAWIQRSPEQLKTFIGNRIKIIQRLTQNCQWNHVSSNENPADLISRGLNASDISSKQLWWHGPDFLREELEANPIDFERITSDSDYLKELKPANVLLTSCKFSLIDDLSKRSNNYTKLLHILSYIFRFLHNSRNPSVKRSGQLDYSEVNEAELCLIKNLQASAFQEEIEFLAKSPQALLYCTRQRFWPLRGRSIARKIVHECVVCFKNKPIVANQLMGSLPRERVNPSFPFLHTGIDYCGPFFIRYKHQRKGTYQKIYVAIFVCLASKAVHLEIVSDLTTDAFLATLKRFVARRGKCATISSDNAKNFVGANRELKNYIIS
ncbi:integrase catalytic domain-containing protein [Trichonephila clavipes]|nr:integrase catalytic domain-containing protein [Trichonephila clavipes]